MINEIWVGGYKSSKLLVNFDLFLTSSASVSIVLLLPQVIQHFYNHCLPILEFLCDILNNLLYAKQKHCAMNAEADKRGEFSHLSFVYHLFGQNSSYIIANKYLRIKIFLGDPQECILKNTS